MGFITSQDAKPDMRREPPRVWVIIGDKAGDNAQCLALAEALGLPFAVKRLHYKPLYRLWNLILGKSLISLDRRRSDPLSAPWPDLIIAAGRRSVPVARWIRRQARGRTRLVQIGRPRAPSRFFDLIVTTPQYCLPVRDNILQLHTPLTTGPAMDAKQAELWQSRFRTLPRPWIAVFVGGATPPYVFDSASAARLGEAINDLAARHAGALLISTSRRTPPAVTDALAAALRVPNFFHRYGTPENPYAAYLTLADAFVVTADSASMLADACAAGRPVFLFDLPSKTDPQTWLRQTTMAVPVPLRERLLELGLLTAPRALAKLHTDLLACGRLRRLEAGMADIDFREDDMPRFNDLALVADRVRALLAVDGREQR